MEQSLRAAPIRTSKACSEVYGSERERLERDQELRGNKQSSMEQSLRAAPTRTSKACSEVYGSEREWLERDQEPCGNKQGSTASKAWTVSPLSLQHTAWPLWT